MTFENTTRRRVLGSVAAAAMAVAGLGLSPKAAEAQEVTLTLHQFLPAQANVPKLILDVWADNIEEASDGRIAIQRFPAMQLGGTPPELIDQAIDGVADIVWAVNGFTPGRFPHTEVFELPFMTENARATSYAFWKMYEEHMADADYADVKVLGTWVHGPGMLHTKEPVASPEDLQGMKIRGGSRMVNQLLERVGAEPIGLPVTAIPEALSKGVIDGTTIPWEVTPALKVPELVSNHTEFDGPPLYNLTFVLAMNKDKWESLPEDLQAIIDANSGLEFSVFAGGTQADADGPARQIAVDMGNTIITVSEEDAAKWEEMAAPVYDAWIADVADKGMDGQALIDQAKALMAEYDAAN
ncbi:TRAP transporter substrate-binding protein [Cognatishimia sp. F0-27]|uniref:TRAP transporter substrate-binding protein n=1 Tax=Cognatishimia sp. F0-27 TaxID=2816855 RepID=UPI001D0C712A|nr:TRAP transporter substrate-binding protein [Cognatishimia sp. F0-27]MCC1491510.1 TRAP transporter substrate-binding protein [Cognatishimia sp. F0-27]